MPFYPARPTHGVPLTSRATVIEVLAKARKEGAFLTSKLNGDRVMLGKVDGKVHVANRHGRWYSYAVKNLEAWQTLPDKTCLDGEVWEQNFYPFEALVVAGEDVRRQSPAARSLAAQRLCEERGVEFKFAELTDDAKVLRLFKQWGGKSNPVLEGFVWRSAGSPYSIMAREDAEVPTWRKLKWTFLLP